MPKQPKKVVRHLDNGARPACGAKPEGSLVVDVENIHYVTCEHCALLTAVGLLGGVTLIDRRN